MTGVLLPGFLVGQFRSFGDRTQYIGPLTKVSVVCGLNNDGKSNVLIAAQSVLSRMGNHQAPKLSNLDVPGQEESVSNWRFRTGIAVPGAGSKLERMLRAVTSARGVPLESLQAHSPIYHHLAALAQSPALASSSEASNDGPFLFRVRVGASSSVEVDEDQARQLLDDLGDGETFRELSQYFTSSWGGGVVHAVQLLEAVRGMLMVDAGLAIPPVALIPATRAIAASKNYEDASLPSLDGKGLPNWLLRLQSPSVGEHRNARARFSRINEFVRDVLERNDAEIWVPWDSHEIYLGLGDTVLPLRNLGTGISQTVLIAAIATVYSGYLICLEEPELHLHPSLLRRLMAYLHERTDNQYLITTHSAAILDDPRTTVFRASSALDGTTTVELVASAGERARLVQSLGYRASDLLQANSIVWVEGPSDRLYLLAWLRAHGAADLIEGVHFSIMFFGGGLMAHLSGRDLDEVDPDLEIDQWVTLLRLNRNMAMIVDSDLASPGGKLGETKERLQREFAARDLPFMVTAGRTVENYVPVDTLATAVARVHPRAAKGWIQPRTRFAQPLNGLENPNKVRIAREAIALSPDWSDHGLSRQVAELIAFVRAAQVASAVTVDSADAAD